MVKVIIAIIAILILAIVGFSAYPSFRTMFDGVSTNGLSPIVAVMTKSMSYVIIGAIIYGAILIWGRKDNG